MGFTKPFCNVAGMGAVLSARPAVEGLTAVDTDVVGLHHPGVVVPPFDAAGIRAEFLPLLLWWLCNRLATL